LKGKVALITGGGQVTPRHLIIVVVVLNIVALMSSRHIFLFSMEWCSVQGIGRLMALRFAKEGCRVVLWDIREDLCHEVHTH